MLLSTTNVYMAAKARKRLTVKSLYLQVLTNREQTKMTARR
jgi:hypothetical protein